jgi:hypothetical protein
MAKNRSFPRANAVKTADSVRCSPAQGAARMREMLVEQSLSSIEKQSATALPRLELPNFR